MRIAIALLFLVSACAEFDQTLQYRIDPPFQTHVDAFFYEAEIRGVDLQKENLIVTTSKDLNRKLGQFSTCGEQRIVEIIDYAAHYEPTHLEVLMFHELGHALLRRGHTCEDNSIMCDDINLQAFTTPAERKILLDELFTNQ